MAALRGTEVLPVPIAEAVAELKLVRSDDPLVRVARSVRTSFGDVALDDLPQPSTPVVSQQ